MTLGVPPGTEGRLLRLSGNFIAGIAGIDSLLTIYGLHPRADPGDLFGQRLNLQKNIARDKMAERKVSSFYFLSICSHLLKQTICMFSLYGRESLSHNVFIFQCLYVFIVLNIHEF